MTASVVNTKGRRSWGVERDERGHRTYSLKILVKSTDALDGPKTALEASGLPAIGDTWDFGNDDDPWAFCLPTMSVRIFQEKEGDPNKAWIITNTFTTKPQNRCQDDSVEDPLDEPDRISGGFVKYTVEARSMFNAVGDSVAILNSAGDIITGIQRDENRPTVRIGQNVADLGLEDFSGKIDKLNDSTLWGLDARKVKLSNVTWQRLIFGTCNFYYSREFEFDINFNTFDLTDVVDAGFRAKDPSGGFIVNKDKNGENVPSQIMLDGEGGINIDPLNAPVFLDADNGLGPVRLYEETNLLELGIPSDLTSNSN